jgi:hypothetical protein
MAVWALLIGKRSGLRLRRKWWHYAAIGAAVLSSVVVYLIVGVFVMSRPILWSHKNTFSLTLLNHSAGRQTTTTLADLDALPGFVGTVGANDRLTPLPRTRTDTIRCEAMAKYKEKDSLTIGGVIYRAIPDYANQPAGEARHCVASPLYASFTASGVASFRADGVDVRKREYQALAAGVSAVLVWLIMFWNLYYRGFVSLYASRRELRRKRHFEQKYSLR